MIHVCQALSDKKKTAQASKMLFIGPDCVNLIYIQFSSFGGCVFFLNILFCFAFLFFCCQKCRKLLNNQQVNDNPTRFPNDIQLHLILLTVCMFQNYKLINKAFFFLIPHEMAEASALERRSTD